MKKEQAYRYVKRLIIDGTWDPEKAINVSEVSEQLNMSRTPIHKALTQLEQEGFLTIIPQVGVFIKRPDHAEVLERLLVCANLDALMTEQATLKMSETELAYLKDILKEMDNLELSSDDYASLNIKFHRKIYEVSKLKYTINLAKQHWDYLYYVGTPDILFSKDKRKRSQTEHWNIYYTIKDKKGNLAKELMEIHMRRVAESLSEKYNKIDDNQHMIAESKSN